MGKASEKTPAKASEKTPAAESKPRAEEKKPGDETRTSWLGMLRKKRFICFFGFLAFCVWILLYANTCNVSKKKDCGYAGITAWTCRTVGGFKLEAKPERVQVEVKRKPGTKLGIKLKDQAISNIMAGAVQEHNDNLPKDSAEIIRLGDKLVKVDGEWGEMMTKALSNTKSKLVKFDINRPFQSSVSSVLPGSLTKGNGFFAKALRSSAFEQWAKSFSFMATTGFACWFLSGYPMASLPVYYITPSAFVAWQTTRCCYNNKIAAPGSPHCYCSSGDSMRTVLEKAWAKTTWKDTEKLFKF